MPTLAQRLNLLAGFDAASRAAILSEAIDHAGLKELPALSRAAVATGRPDAMAPVIRRLHEIAEDPAPLVRRIPGKSLRPAVEIVLSDPDPRSTRNVIDVVAARPELVDLLPRRLVDERAGVAAAAAGALRTIAIAIHGRRGRRRAPDAIADRLDRAIAAAGRAYRAHRADDVLLTIALLSERPGPSLRALLDDEDEPVTRAVRSMVDRSDDPLVHANVVRWLANPRLARAATRALGRVTGAPGWADVLRDGHLLRTPGRRPALLRLDRPGRCVPSVSAAAALPAALQTHVPLLLERLDLPTRTRRNRLTDMVALPSAAARQAAVTALIATGAGAADGLVPFALDRDPRVARLALHGLLLGGMEPDAGLLDRLALGGHRALARRAAARRARGGAQGFFRSWSLLSSQHRRVAALVVRASDRAGLVAGLRVLLAQGPEPDRLHAIDLARRLRLVVDLEPELIDLAGSANPREASASIAALPAGRTPRRISVLAEALDHAHPRVVANAVEGLVRAGASRAIDITSLVRTTANRPRANAVRALLHADPVRGVPALLAMLTDADPLHRVSAIWVARHSGAGQTLRAISELARADRVPEVRTRAEAARRWLAATARAASRSPHPAGGRSASARRPDGGAREVVVV